MRNSAFYPSIAISTLLLIFLFFAFHQNGKESVREDRIQKLEILFLGDCNNLKGCLAIFKNIGNVTVRLENVKLFRDKKPYFTLDNFKDPIGINYKKVKPGRIFALRIGDICNNTDLITLKTFSNQSEKGLFFIYNSTILCPENKTGYRENKAIFPKNVSIEGRASILLLGDCLHKRGCLLIVKNTGNVTIDTRAMELYKGSKFYAKVFDFKTLEGARYERLSPGKVLVFRAGSICDGNDYVELRIPLNISSGKISGAYRNRILCPFNLTEYVSR